MLAVLGFWRSPTGCWGAGSGPAPCSLFMGVGALLIFFGVALFSAQLVRPLASVLGWPGRRLAGAAGIARPRERDAGTRSGPARPPPR